MRPYIFETTPSGEIYIVDTSTGQREPVEQTIGSSVSLEGDIPAPISVASGRIHLVAA